MGLAILAAQGSLDLPGVNGGGGDGGTVSVTYGLSGSAKGALITFTDGSGSIQQNAHAAVPNSMTFRAAHGAILVFSAQNLGATGDLNCVITADGTTINTGHSSGAYAVVSCSGTIP